MSGTPRERGSVAIRNAFVVTHRFGFPFVSCSRRRVIGPPREFSYREHRTGRRNACSWLAFTAKQTKESSRCTGGGQSLRRFSLCWCWVLSFTERCAYSDEV